MVVPPAPTRVNVSVVESATTLDCPATAKVPNTLLDVSTWAFPEYKVIPTIVITLAAVLNHEL